MSLELAGYAWLWKFTLLGFSEKFRLYNIWNQFFVYAPFSVSNSIVSTAAHKHT